MALSTTVAPHPKKDFLDFFPVPDFLRMSLTGINITDTSIQMVEFEKSVGRHGVLKHCVEVELANGIVISGTIQDKEALIIALTELRKKYGLQYVRAILPEEKAYLFTTEVEKATPENLRDVVAFTIEENAPVLLKESTFDYEIVSAIPQSSKVRVAVTVLLTEVVETYVKCFEAAGLTPISFDIVSQAITRALVPRGDNGSYLIVNLGERTTGLYVAEQEITVWSSTLPFGIMDMKKDSDVSRLKTEMRKLFAFWNTRIGTDGTQQERIQKIVFCGEGATEGEFISSLMSGIEIEYTLRNVWANAFSIDDQIPQIPFDESLKYGAAIGAVLPSIHHYV